MVVVVSVYCEFFDLLVTQISMYLFATVWLQL